MALVEGLGSAKTPSWLGILRVWSLQDPEEEGTSGVDAKSTRNVRVEADGTQVAGHVGLHALGSFADRLGLGETLSAAVGWTGRGTPVHDRSKVLTQAMLMLAGGGDSCADIETLASQGRLFGEVSSDTTLYWDLHRHPRCRRGGPGPPSSGRDPGSGCGHKALPPAVTGR